MASSLVGAAISLVVCHGGPATHFATFAESLRDEGYTVQVYASGPALDKLREYKIDGVIPFSADKLSREDELKLAAQIAKICSTASVVLTDVGHLFDISLQKALEKEAPQVLRLAYYDNPESYVPGGYSSTAADVMLAAQKVLFANANLVEVPLYREPDRAIDLPKERRVALGYYQTELAEKIAKCRETKQGALREKFFTQQGLKDDGQKIWVYFGGNNEEYFTKAFPALLQFLTEGERKEGLSNYIIILQQHPGARRENRDGEQLKEWIEQENRQLKIFKSNWTTDDMQVIADGGLYYQTSMGPQFILAGIPMVQVGHNTYEDILVKNNLCPSVTNSSAFLSATAKIERTPQTKEQKEALFKSLGIRADWLNTFEQLIKK